MQKLRDQEDSKIPPGCRLLEEEERVKTLEDLKESRKDINNALERMPIANSNMQIAKKKKELEDKLLRIDRAIETFSKKTVYIAM